MMTDETHTAGKKRRIAITILLVIWTVIRTVFVFYAVLFTITATVLLYIGYQKGYHYYNTYWLTPINEVKRLKAWNPAESAYMSLYREELRSKGEADSLIWKFVPLDSISGALVASVLAAEDDGFYTHPGISIDAIFEAMEYNRAANSIKRGASTITQQLAKNLFLSPEKTFERKIKELGYTVLLEKYLGKERILELYLNYAQWGKNVFGCEAAANVYYKKSSLGLTQTEAARMAACLAMPTRITPLHTKSTFMGKRIMVIANNMYIHRKIDDAGYTALTGEPPPGKEAGMDAEPNAEPAVEPNTQKNGNRLSF